MLRRTTSGAALVLLALGAASTTLGAACHEGARSDGPTARVVSDAADRHGVPNDLMLAIADVEGGLRLRAVRDMDADDEIPVAGVLELRHATFDSLARGATLIGLPQEQLVADLATGTEAGAMVLDDLAKDAKIDRKSIGAWAPVVEQLSGYREPWRREEYRARVFSKLRAGGTLKARNGETIELEPRDDIPTELTFTPPMIGIEGGTPDYSGATWYSTSCSDKCNTSRSADIEMIAIHDTEGGWDASVSTLQFDAGKSVHYLVDADGSRIAQFIPESYNGWHVGNSYYNNRMVGIENVGQAGLDEYQTGQYQATAALVKDIAQRNGLPVDRDHVIAHQEVPDGDHPNESAHWCDDSPGDCIASQHFGGANHHTDPGIYWEWCQFMELAGGTCKCNDTFQLWNCVHDGSMMNRCVDGNVEIQHCASPCVVEPNGTNDHCDPDTSTSSVSTATAATSNASASASTGSTGGAPGSGGAGGSTDDGGDVDGGCSCRTTGDAPLAPAGAMAIAGIVAALARRKRRC